jgi:alanyl-tRNA synthetase
MLIADGVMPSNEGRGYVLRRVIRRAMVHARRIDAGEGLSSAVPMVDEILGTAYREVHQGLGRIIETLEAEEARFGVALRQGTERLNALLDRGQLGPDEVFYLHDTLGFPTELTIELAQERGVQVDPAAVEALMQQQRNRSKAASGGFTGPVARTATTFVGYDHADSDTTVAELFPVADTPEQADLVLRETPFYAERGGQTADTGWLTWSGGEGEVLDVQAQGEAIRHRVRLRGRPPQPGEAVHAEIDRPRRAAIARHHTATHLLHRALKDVLGPGTSQQGSYVGPELLRFDFNAPQAMSREQVEAVSAIINDRSMDDLPVNWEIMSIDQARASGAVMMFGEKYGEQVRVVSIGEYSRELCGGTHTHHSGELGAVVIGREFGIGSGKRRIEAYAGQAALGHLKERLNTLDALAMRVGARSSEDLPQRIDALLEEVETLRREVQRRQQQQAHESAAQLSHRARQVHGVNVVAEAVQGASEDELKQMVDAVRQDLRSAVVVLGTQQDGRLRFVAGVTPDLVQRIRAGDLLKQVAAQAGGGAGGPPHFATGGGTQPERLGEALAHTFTVVERALSGA